MTIESTESGIENAAPVASESAPAVTSAPETTPIEAGASDNVPTQIVPPAYTPNTKFKYWDAKENAQVEKEFDEWAKGLAKDEKMEKLLRDHHEKVYGHDALKSSRDKYAQETSAVKEQVQQFQGVLDKMDGYVQRDYQGNPKDLDSAFAMLRLTEDDVLKHALKIADRRQLPPEQQQAWQQQRQQQQEYHGVQQQLTQVQQQYNMLADRARSTEMQYTMQRPDIAEAKQRFDEVRGPGAFERAVIERGQYHYAVSKIDVSAEQAANEVMSFMLHNPAATGGNPMQQAEGGGQKAPLPVLPNIKGKGTSPAKKVPSSIDDLRKISRDLQSNA